MRNPSPPPQDEALCGKLLFSTPVIHDGVFRKSVILVTRHDSKGAQGFILNRPSGKTVGHFLTGSSPPSLANTPVHIGGPVGQEHLTFAALSWNSRSGLRHATRISAEEAAGKAEDPNVIVCAFLGYSSWASGQLENELLQQSWLSLSPTENLFSENFSPALWKTLLCQAGPRYQIIADSPRLPFLN